MVQINYITIAVLMSFTYIIYLPQIYLPFMTNNNESSTNSIVIIEHDLWARFVFCDSQNCRAEIKWSSYEH